MFSSLFSQIAFQAANKILESHGFIPGSSWSHFLCLIQFFPDLTNFLKFCSQGTSQHRFKSYEFFLTSMVGSNNALQAAIRRV
jgi:hypothetical protein